MIISSCRLILSFPVHPCLLKYDLSWVTLGEKQSGLRPYWEIQSCAMGAAAICLRGPHVVIVVATFSLCKFPMEMELQVV